MVRAASRPGATCSIDWAMSSPITQFAAASSGTARPISRQAAWMHEAMSPVESMSVPSQSKITSS